MASLPAAARPDRAVLCNSTRRSSSRLRGAANAAASSKTISTIMTAPPTCTPPEVTAVTSMASARTNRSPVPRGDMRQVRALLFRLFGITFIPAGRIQPRGALRRRAAWIVGPPPTTQPPHVAPESKSPTPPSASQPRQTRSPQPAPHPSGTTTPDLRKEPHDPPPVVMDHRLSFCFPRNPGRADQTARHTTRPRPRANRTNVQGGQWTDYSDTVECVLVRKVTMLPPDCPLG